MQRTNRQFLGLLKTGTLVLAGIMLVLAGCNGKAEGPDAASKSDPKSAVKKPPAKEPPATPKKPPATPKEPPATPKKPPTARGDIPQPPKPKNDKQKFVLYDVKYIKDAKLEGCAIIARVWARKPEFFEKPGVRATFLAFDDPVKGDLSGMTHTDFRVTAGAGGTRLSWRTQNPSGRAQSLKGAGTHEKQYGVVAVVFNDSFLEGAASGFMLRGDKDFKPASNILLFGTKSFKDGDTKKEFAKIKVQLKALGQTKPSGK